MHEPVKLLSPIPRCSFIHTCVFAFTFATYIFFYKCDFYYSLCISYANATFCVTLKERTLNQPIQKTKRNMYQCYADGILIESDE